MLGMPLVGKHAHPASHVIVPRHAIVPCHVIMPRHVTVPLESLSECCLHATGLPRLLVDIRHEASHNDLPSLPLLRLAASDALQWLQAGYWQRQQDHLHQQQQHVVKLLQVCFVPVPLIRPAAAARGEAATDMLCASALISPSSISMW